MKFIAHRGNISGANPLEENKPEYIDAAIQSGFDVEIDVRLLNNKFYLGHDESQYYISTTWLNERIDLLWIHCKDLNTLEFFSNSRKSFNYFWHQKDDFALTSKKYIWTYPGESYTSKSVIVMPESNLNIDFNVLKMYNCFGICSDYVESIK
jgi:glycerophosphoryl diester phosphodiesterase